MRPISFFQNEVFSAAGSPASASGAGSASGFGLRPISFFQIDVFSFAGSGVSAGVGSGSPSDLGLRPNEMSFFQSTID